MKQRGKRILAALAAAAFVVANIPAAALAEDAQNEVTQETVTTEEGGVMAPQDDSTSTAPRATVDTVTWNGGLVQVPVDLGSYSPEELSVQVLMNYEKGGQYFWRYFSPTLTDKYAAFSIVKAFESCETGFFFTEAGQYPYPLTISFYDPADSDSTATPIGTSQFNLVVAEDSIMWHVSAETYSFDGSQDVTFHFTNGTNNYELASIPKIQVFTVKGVGGPSYPILTDGSGFTCDMEAGTVTIDKDALKEGLLEYKKQGGELISTIFLDAEAITSDGENITYFNTIDWPEVLNGTTIAWELNISDLDLSETGDRKGDVNQDEEVDIQDLRLVLRHLSGRIKFTDEQKEIADVTGEGSVDVSDLRQILLYVCRKIETL